MRGGKPIFEMIRRAAIPALALIIVGTFAGHAIAGPNGILAWGGYHRALKDRQLPCGEGSAFPGDDAFDKSEQIIPGTAEL